MARLRPAAIVAALVALSISAACDESASAPEVTELAILTRELSSARVGQLYDEAIQAEGGGGYFWEIVQGELPPGLALLIDDLTRDEAFLTGVPESEGSFLFTLRLSTEEGAQADTVELRLEVLPALNALRIENIALPPTVAGGEVTLPLRLAGGGGSPTWSVASGALPAGLRLEASGRITGAAADTGSTRFVLRATSGESRTFKAFTLRVVPDDLTSFQLTLFPVVPISERIRPQVEAAVRRWERILTGDLVGGSIPEDFFEGDECGGVGEATNGTAVDDVLVLVDIDSIDGPAQVLGQAGPCGIRGDGLPFIALLTLDETDLIPLSSSTTLADLVAHELGHTLGFGTLWTRATLLDGEGTDDPRFTGESAVEEWHELGGEGEVPLENEGGEGTVDSHWRESVFNRELMTGFLEPVDVPQPTSRVTIGAMEDLGYAVDFSAADPYELPATTGLRASTVAPVAWDEILAGPVRVLSDFGRARPALGR